MNLKFLFVVGKDQKSFDSAFEKAVNSIHLQGGQMQQVIPGVNEAGFYVVIIYQVKPISLTND